MPENKWFKTVARLIWASFDDDKGSWEITNYKKEISEMNNLKSVSPIQYGIFYASDLRVTSCFINTYHLEYETALSKCFHYYQKSQKRNEKI